MTHLCVEEQSGKHYMRRICNIVCQMKSESSNYFEPSLKCSGKKCLIRPNLCPFSFQVGKSRKSFNELQLNIPRNFLKRWCFYVSKILNKFFIYSVSLIMIEHGIIYVLKPSKKFIQIQRNLQPEFDRGRKSESSVKPGWSSCETFGYYFKAMVTSIQISIYNL